MASAVIGANVTSSGAIPGGGIWHLWRVFVAEPVVGAATVDSVVRVESTNLGFEIMEFSDFALHITASSNGGTPSLTVQIVQSWDDTAANYVVPAAGGTITATLADELAHVYAVSPAAMPRLRIRITGNAGNPNDTTVTAYLLMRT